MIWISDDRPDDVEPACMTVVANNNPGRGEWYIEMLGFRGAVADEDYEAVQGTTPGLIGYTFRLGQFYRAIEMLDQGFDDAPRALLALVPEVWHSFMSKQIDDFERDDLHRLLNGTLEWDESYTEDERPSC
jgi:hypothetical protein